MATVRTLLPCRALAVILCVTGTHAVDPAKLIIKKDPSRYTDGTKKFASTQLASTQQTGAQPGDKKHASFVNHVKAPTASQSVKSPVLASTNGTSASSSQSVKSPVLASTNGASASSSGGSTQLLVAGGAKNKGGAGGQGGSTRQGQMVQQQQQQQQQERNGIPMAELDKLDQEAKAAAVKKTGRQEFSQLEAISASPLEKRKISDPEDKSFLMKTLLPKLIDVPKKYTGRKILIDCGAKTYASSVGWFLTNYGEAGVKFDHVYAWEASEGTFQVPKREGGRITLYDGIRVGATEEPAGCMAVTDMHGVANGKACKQMGLAKWFDSQSFSKKDFVVLKMDVEGSEYSLIGSLTKQLPQVAEMMVEIHFAHPDMTVHNWDQYAPKTLADAQNMLLNLRKNGTFVHYWP